MMVHAQSSLEFLNTDEPASAALKQWAVYGSSDPKRTSRFLGQYGIRSNIARVGAASFSVAGNANVLQQEAFKGSGSTFRAVPSLDVIGSFHRNWGMTLSYYPQGSKAVTLKVHYALGNV